MLAFKRGVEYVLAVPAEPHPFPLRIDGIARLRRTHIHISGIKHQLVVAVRIIVELGMRAYSHLLLGVETLGHSRIVTSRLVV